MADLHDAEKHTEKRTETHACDLIDRRALMKEFSEFVKASNNSDFARTPTWNDAVSLVGSMPSIQPDSKESSFTHKALDLIERQAAIDLVRDVCNAVMSGCESLHDPETKDEVYEDIREVDAILKCNKEVRIALRNMPSAQQDCTECEEYDQTTHSCPKYCEVIRRTLEEAKQERTGRWIEYDNSHCECPFCHVEWSYFDNEVECFNYCPNCGARLEGEG